MTWFDQRGVEDPGSFDNLHDACNCDQARDLSRELESERALSRLLGDWCNTLLRHRDAKRLEVIELRLRAWLNDARRAPWSSITDIRAKQERRYARQRERLQAVMALRVINEVSR